MQTSTEPHVAADRSAAGRPHPGLVTTDRTGIGEPVSQDVVVTYSEHAVAGRDATAGADRWSYTRTDRRICSVVSQDAAVVAIYAHDGLCDEVTGLDIGSGARHWVRTLLVQRHAGRHRGVRTLGQRAAGDPGAIELIEPTGGLDWWYDEQPAGCRNP